MKLAGVQYQNLCLIDVKLRENKEILIDDMTKKTIEWDKKYMTQLDTISRKKLEKLKLNWKANISKVKNV